MRASIIGVVREAVIAAMLTGLMILLFLGSWRSTIIIAISIPLSILTSIIVLGLIGQTINIMTLGGLALAVGILVDDATVTIENIERYLEEGHGLHDAILEGAAQISVPALVSTLCICIVFLPMFFLSGVSRYLFVPLAEAVVFAMLASYVLSRTLVPTLAMYLLKRHDHNAVPSRNILARFQRGFERRFEQVRSSYVGLLEAPRAARDDLRSRLPAALPLRVSARAFPRTELLPQQRHRLLHPPRPRAKAAPASKRRPSSATSSNKTFARSSLPAEMDNILDNIGLPYSTLNTAARHLGPDRRRRRGHPRLAERRPPSNRRLRRRTPTEPAAGLSRRHLLLPARRTSSRRSSTSACLRRSMSSSRAPTSPARARSPDTMLEQLRQVPGLVDLRIQQPDDYPVLNVDVDRTKARRAATRCATWAAACRTCLSGSSQLTPMFFLNYKNGVNYSIVAAGAAVRHPVAQRSAERAAVFAYRKAAGDSCRRRQHQPQHRDAGHQSLQHPPHA